MIIQYNLLFLLFHLLQSNCKYLRPSYYKSFSYRLVEADREREGDVSWVVLLNTVNSNCIDQQRPFHSLKELFQLDPEIHTCLVSLGCNDKHQKLSLNFCPCCRKTKPLDLVAASIGQVRRNTALCTSKNVHFETCLYRAVWKFHSSRVKSGQFHCIWSFLQIAVSIGNS